MRKGLWAWFCFVTVMIFLVCFTLGYVAIFSHSHDAAKAAWLTAALGAGAGLVTLARLIYEEENE